MENKKEFIKTIKKWDKGLMAALISGLTFTAWILPALWAVLATSPQPW